MQKDPATWLVLRIVGLFFMGYAAMELYSFATNLLAVVVVSDASASSEGLVRLPHLRWEALFQSAVFASLSFYFLRRGKMVHRWLMRGSPAEQHS